MKINVLSMIFLFAFSCSNNTQTKPITSKPQAKTKNTSDSSKKQQKQAKQTAKKQTPKTNKTSSDIAISKKTAKNKKPLKQKTTRKSIKPINETHLKEKFVNILKAIPSVKLGKVKEHYYTSNETRYDLWYKYIKNLGGVYMGVGADQNYSLAAVTNPELVILMDYDKEVVYLHKMYKIIVKKSENPSQVLELLKRKHNKEIYEAALKEYDQKTAKWIKAIHKGGGKFILKHFKHRFKQHKKAGIRFWLSDPKMYAKWRSLVLNNRVWEFPGDLTKAVTMINISTALKKMNKKMRVMYFSNAEEFWIYRKPFRQAIINMPFDDKSMIIRSVVLGKKYKIGWKFHYTVQKALDFVSWMKYKGYFSIKSIARRYRIPLENTLYLSKLPAAPEKPGKI